MAVTDDIKARVDIVELIGESMALRKTGRTFVGFCPFHSNTRTPAFTVYPDSQSYHCFGCKASGTIFDWVMHKQGLDFPAALRQLADRAGVKLEERAEAEQQSQLRTRLLDINAAAATFFQHLLRSNTYGQPGRDYLEKRALSPAAVESFQIGFVPDQWSLLLSYLTDKKGFALDEIEAAGLIVQREHGGYYDRFRGRLIFPIRDAAGGVVGFGGRAIGDAQPKYLNSPQTPLFDKSAVLYGLDLAREAIRREGVAVIVEGYVDVIGAHQAGFANVVAPLGTALSDVHVKLLRRFAKKIVLALDADAAGQQAMLKGLDKIQASDDDVRPVATPQGVLRWEADVEIRIIALPPGQDPDEVIRANPEHWRALVASAQPVMDFYLAAYTSGLNLEEARDQAQALERLLPLLRALPEAEQRVYIGRIERLLPDVKAELIVDMVRRTPRQGRHSDKERGKQGDGFRSAAHGTQPVADHDAQRATGNAQRATPLGPEDQLLGLLLRHPPARKAVEELLAADLAPFATIKQLMSGTTSELFERVENRLLWESWCQQPSGRLVGGWVQSLPPELAAQARQVVTLAPLDQTTYRDAKAAVDHATQLRVRLVERWLRRLAAQIAETDDAAEQQRMLGQLADLQQFFARIKQPPRSSTWDDLLKARQ
jgi:DNA primase